MVKRTLATDPASFSAVEPSRNFAYPVELPITDRRQDLLEAIRDNQVLIVAGETGSGKSTQLPKMCLELGFGAADKFIGHTQPRRLAARTIAERVANELQSELGDVVGYKVRFDDSIRASTSIKLMTDGILLAETQRDRLLKKYDVIIIDEAHERSLNIDFILGYLKQILPKRPDLKVIVTSATIDTDRFSKHFDNAPIIEVSGRMYPVEIRYQPLEAESSRATTAPPPSTNQTTAKAASSKPSSSSATTEQATGIAQAVQTLWNETDGDILVFCSGEQEIRDAMDAVAELNLANVELLPLYARLSSAEQQRVFKSHQRRRVVVSTNVAETSVTVPGIRSVVDAGTARISRYSSRTKVQRLPIEPISQASANQRSGRCGRLGPGICIRLYDEEDFLGRDAFTEPEIQRTNLAAVILQMFSLKLGAVAEFGFVDPPDNRAITDGLRLLEELDAIDLSGNGQGSLTATGRKLSKLPIEPRLGRMLLEADRNGSLKEVLIIVAGLAVADPKERPADAQQAAREAHKQHADPASDFISYLNLWKYLQTERKKQSGNQFRKQCRREFLNFLRIREWQATHRQLQQLCKQLKLTTSNNPANHDTIHQALLTGLLSQVGYLEVDGDAKAKKQRSGHRRKLSTYVGARNIKFAVNPGSSLAKANRQWVMAAELVETSQVWARVAAAVDPEWICEAGSHITKHSFAEPWWDANAGVAMSRERITLFGLTVVANRRAQLRAWSVPEAREMFIHHALVLNDWQNGDAERSAYSFVAANNSVIETVDELQARQRNRDTEDRNEKLFRFFDERLPENICSVGDFNGWWKRVSEDDPQLLHIPEAALLDESQVPDEKLFPTTWPLGDNNFELAYEFDPASNIDGVSIHVPVGLLASLRPDEFEWSVPGFRSELIAQLLRSLPKKLRKQLLPISDAVTWAQLNLEPTEQSMLEQLAQKMSARSGATITANDFDIERTAAHLRPTFRVVNDDYEAIAEGKDLDDLRTRLVEHTQQALQQRLRQTGDSHISSDSDSSSSNNTEPLGLERSGLTDWDFNELPSAAVVVVDGQQIQSYPALFDEGKTVAVRLFATKAEQFDAMWEGVRRFLRIRLGSPLRTLDGLVSDEAKLWLAAPPVQSKADWYNDAIACVLDDCISKLQPLPKSDVEFERLADHTQTHVKQMMAEVAERMSWLVVNLSSLNRDLEATPHGPTRSDLEAHRDRLFYPGFMAGLGFERLDDAIRYATSIRQRITSLGANPGRDRDSMALCQNIEETLATAIATQGKTEELEALLWEVEELRAAVFSKPSAGSTRRVSAKKIRMRLAQQTSP